MSKFTAVRSTRIRHIPALVSCIPKGGAWGACQRLWLFSCGLTEEEEPTVHGGKIVSIECQMLFYQPNLPEKIRLDVPKTDPADLQPYIAIAVPSWLVGLDTGDYNDTPVVLKGVYSSSIAEDRKSVV